jgi:hypothetical protein
MVALATAFLAARFRRAGDSVPALLLAGSCGGLARPDACPPTGPRLVPAPTALWLMPGRPVVVIGRHEMTPRFSSIWAESLGERSAPGRRSTCQVPFVGGASFAPLRATGWFVAGGLR